MEKYKFNSDLYKFNSDLRFIAKCFSLSLYKEITIQNENYNRITQVTCDYSWWVLKWLLDGYLNLELRKILSQKNCKNLRA